MTEFLGLRDNEKTAFFIDGANLYKTARGLGFDMDYKSLLARSKKSCRLVRAYYYNSHSGRAGSGFFTAPSSCRLARL